MNKNAINIKTFCPTDWQESVELWKRVPGMGLSAADGEDAIRLFLERNPGLSQVATSGGKLVGTIMAGSDGRRAHIYHACVAPELQGLGIGKALLTECLARLAAQGLEKANLYCKADNTAGMAFWAHAGWRLRDDLVTFSREI